VLNRGQTFEQLIAIRNNQFQQIARKKKKIFKSKT
jgi:hypothetical protein